jgi:hypothetical protein
MRSGQEAAISHANRPEMGREDGRMRMAAAAAAAGPEDHAGGGEVPGEAAAEAPPETPDSSEGVGEPGEPERKLAPSEGERPSAAAPPPPPPASALDGS